MLDNNVNYTPNKGDNTLNEKGLELPFLSGINVDLEKIAINFSEQISEIERFIQRVGLREDRIEGNITNPTAQIRESLSQDIKEKVCDLMGLSAQLYCLTILLKKIA